MKKLKQIGINAKKALAVLNDLKVEKINKVLVFPGGGERNGITKAES